MRSPRQTRLSPERLKDRLVPAGNIAVEVRGNDLVLTGDDRPNGLEISPGPGANQVVLRGLDGTLVGGHGDQQVLTFPQQLADLRVVLKGGKDVLVITGRSEADPHWPA